MRLLLTVLTLVAGLSPLFTFARLWQVKEWRIDRLREHLRYEGWLRQLFGIVRPVVIGIALLTGMIASSLDWELLDIPVELILHWSFLALLAWFTLFRFVIGRQSHPVWTMKAISIVVLSSVLLTVVAWIFSGLEFGSVLLMIFLLFPFLTVIIVWWLLNPLDRFLKMRVLRKARSIRQSCKNLIVVGITGSVGKTTTKEFLAHILKDRSILVTPAHVNTEMGVASLMIRCLKNEHQVFIVEMGAYKKGEIRLLCSLTCPQIGIITYVGEQHLALFGSREDLIDAKCELFSALPADGYAFLNADVDCIDKFMSRASCPVMTASTGGHATYEAFDIVENSDSVSFTLRGTSFSVPVQGTHQVVNILLAAAASETLGVPIAESAKRLMNFKGLPQTFEKKTGAKGQVVLDDSYNVSPASFRAAIEWARSYPLPKKILITSGLLELGREERSIHQELGALSRGVFQEVIFLNKKCARYFEQGFGKQIRVLKGKTMKVDLKDDLLIVCEGRMPEKFVEKLLS